MSLSKSSPARGLSGSSNEMARGRRPGIRSVRPVTEQNALPDRLEAIPDRPDLERLFDRNVDVAKIMRLMARQVSREQIQALLASEEFDQELKKLLG
jgi:hypothetical protein